MNVDAFVARTIVDLCSGDAKRMIAAATEIPKNSYFTYGADGTSNIGASFTSGQHIGHARRAALLCAMMSAALRSNSVCFRRQAYKSASISLFPCELIVLACHALDKEKDAVALTHLAVAIETSATVGEDFHRLAVEGPLFRGLKRALADEATYQTAAIRLIEAINSLFTCPSNDENWHCSEFREATSRMKAELTSLIIEDTAIEAARQTALGNREVNMVV